MQTYETWMIPLHTEQIDKLPDTHERRKCEVCDEDAKMLRFRRQYPFGDQAEADFIGEVRQYLDSYGELRDKVTTRCVAHFYWLERHSTGEFYDPLGGEIMPKPDKETPYQRMQRRKAQAIRAYGPGCAGCGRDDVRLYVCLKPRLSQEGFWAQEGIKSWDHKYEYLEAEGYPPICDAVCGSCLSESRSTRTITNKATLRDRALAAYGGSCVRCGQTDPGLLWLVRVSGPVLRYQGSQRKMPTHAKYRFLLARGCPDTHQINCRECWETSRKGKGDGYSRSDPS